MKTRVQLKNIYLIAMITIGLIALGIGSTFAMFTATSTINNPISFNSTLTSTDSLSETKDIIIPPHSDKYVDLVISNTSATSLNYIAWYINSSDTLEVASTVSDDIYGAVGTLPSSASFTLKVQLRNNSSLRVVVTLGVSSSSKEIIIPSNATGITLGSLPILGYTKVGSPIIDASNKLLSSDENYIKTPFVFDNTNNPWEMRLKASLSNINNEEDISYNLLNLVDSNNTQVKGIAIKLDNSNNLSLFLSSNNTTWNIVDEEDNFGINITDLIDKDIYIKFGWTGEKYYIEVSLDNTIWNKTYYQELNSSVNIMTGYAIAFGNNLTSTYNIYLDSIELYINEKIYWKAI